jgi:hypothetical protein
MEKLGANVDLIIFYLPIIGYNLHMAFYKLHMGPLH